MKNRLPLFDYLFLFSLSSFSPYIIDTSALLNVICSELTCSESEFEEPVLSEVEESNY